MVKSFHAAVTYFILSLSIFATELYFVFHLTPTTKTQKYFFSVTFLELPKCDLLLGLN